VSRLIDRGELLGALLGLAKVPPSDPRRAEWKRAGDVALASTKTDARSA
jgi:Conjugal transfer protein TraD